MFSHGGCGCAQTFDKIVIRSATISDSEPIAKALWQSWHHLKARQIATSLHAYPSSEVFADEIRRDLSRWLRSRNSGSTWWMREMRKAGERVVAPPPDDQLTDGGPSESPELPSCAAGPPFGAALGLLSIRFNKTAFILFCSFTEITRVSL